MHFLASEVTGRLVLEVIVVRSRFNASLFELRAELAHEVGRNAFQVLFHCSNEGWRVEDKVIR